MRKLIASNHYFSCDFGVRSHTGPENDAQHRFTTGPSVDRLTYLEWQLMLVRTRTLESSLFLSALLLTTTGCGVVTTDNASIRFLNDPPTATSSQAQATPGQQATIAPRPTAEVVQDKAEKWFFGPGLGRAMTNVGTSILFPPYAFYLLGNATLSLTGLQPLYMTDLLPDKPREGVLEVYDAFTSVPGRLTSAAAGREYPENTPENTPNKTTEPTK